MLTRTRFGLLACAGTIALGAIVVDATQSTTSPRIYELRTYTASPGRLGDLQTVFRSHSTRLFALHGIQNVFAGTVLEGAATDGADVPNMFVWIVAHRDRPTAERAWTAVESDAAWKAAWATAEKAGPLLAKAPLSTLMTPTDYSPAGTAAAEAGPRLFELRKYNTGPAGLPYTAHRFQLGMAEIIAKAGMTPVGYWTATDQSAFVYLVAHDTRDAARAAWSNFMTPYRAFMTEYPKRADALPAAARTPEENRFLVPTDFSAHR